MELSIITVNYNDKEVVLKQIESVKIGARGLEYEQIISDNGSTDGSIEMIRSQFSDIKIIENGKNLGFGGANNVALKHASGEFILFLNPDMLVLPDTLKKLVDFMRTRPEIGIAGPKLVDENGNFNEKSKPRRFPGIIDQVAIILKIHHLIPKVLEQYMYSGFNSEVEQEVDSIRGSFILARGEVFLKLGRGFDPRYFIWFEDVDLCREVKKMGYKIFYTPVISCVDMVGQTFKRQSGALKQGWFLESMVKYFKKWEPAYKWIIISALRPVGIFLADVASFLKK